MHRVELKDLLDYSFSAKAACVPNAPCGVESRAKGFAENLSCTVPNAPCGVESIIQDEEKKHQKSS